MAIMKMGTVQTTAIFILRTKSLYTLFSSESVGSIGTKSIPHMGQEPGPSLTTSGCMGQVYIVLLLANSASLTKSIPQTGQSPGLSYTFSPSQCIGQ